MPEIWISTTRTDRFALGQSRIGGAPDLPIGTAWPRHRWSRRETETWPDYAKQELEDAIERGEVLEELTHVALALPFVAQIDLDDVARFGAPFDRGGQLWLFADQQTTLGELGGYPYQASACLYAARASLARVEPPPTPETLPGLALTFAAATGEDQAEPRHALLPATFEGVIGDVPPPGYQGLLRVDSDYTLDETLNWGDAAWITFALPPQALVDGRWDEVRAFRFCG